jgi:peptide deformylase
MKEIVQKENKVLRKTSDEIPLKKIGSEKIQKVLEEMHESLATQKDGVALAAPQIAESLRIFVVSPIVYKYEEYEDLEKRLVFINPKIIWKSRDSKKMDEGCLSVRPWYGKVKRSSRATVEAYDENGERFEMEGRGLMAQIFQHEIDHLDGILFTDKAKDLREINLEEYEK